MGNISSQLDEVFGALSNDKRRGMINYLSLKPATISMLATEFDLSLPAIHKHIKVLEQANLILRKKVGRTNFIALNKSALGLAQDWISCYRTHWGNDQETLENYIASLKD